MSISRLMQMAAAGAGGDYQISRSLRFNSADSAYLSRTPASAGNRKTWTWSGWVKRGIFTGSGQSLFGAYTDSNNRMFLHFNSANPLFIFGITGGVVDISVSTNGVFRDVSAWYHVVFVLDTTQATAANRAKIYVNGVQQSLSFSTAPSQNADLYLNTAQPHKIGDLDGTVFYDGYMTEINFIDGQALTPSSFGETNATTGVWSPIQFNGPWNVGTGVNGFYLNFSDNTSTTTLGEDQAGSNDWTLNNFSVTAGAGNDSLVDVPTRNTEDVDTGAGGEVRGNYCTLNPLSTTTGTYSQGNLRFVGANSGKQSNGTISVSTGKWYWEVTLASAPYSPRASNSDWTSFGFSLATIFDGAFIAGSSNAVVLSDSGYYNNFSGAKTDSGTAFNSGDVLAIAVDLDANTFTFYRNNTSLVTGTIGGTPGRELVPCQSSYSSAYGLMDCNFGQRPFAYTAPSGFKALVTTNLPEPTVVQGDDYFNTTLYTGDGTTNRTITTGLQSDFVWIKRRNDAIGHLLFDVIRGAGKTLRSQSPDAESNDGSYYVQQFNSDNFLIGNIDTAINAIGGTYVSWVWKAGVSNVTNGDGTITSTVRANTTSGFSIVTYTGSGSAATVGHGLGVAPKMVIVKRRNGSVENWMVYHASNTTPNANAGNNRLLLNLTNASNSDSAIWNDTNPTFSVFSVGTSSEVNGNTATYVAYCFAEVEGFSKFGSYTGNASADGPFVYTGFRPAFVLIKPSSAVDSWQIEDAARSPFNVVNDQLFPNVSDAEQVNAVTRQTDFLSNGFKLRGTNAGVNGSGTTYIYMAFAENPFKNSLAR
jgi:hypothetical protein